MKVMYSPDVLKTMLRDAAARPCRCEGLHWSTRKCSRCEEVGDLLDVLRDTVHLNDVLGEPR